MFQHDNAPKKSTKTWFANVGVKELKCAAQSPDVHPTENTWDELDHQLNTRPSHVTSVPDFSNALLTE